MKKEQIIFWVSTGIIFLFKGVMPALTGNSDMAKQAEDEYIGLLNH